jgi:NAD(P) transhydrogenase
MSDAIHSFDVVVIGSGPAGFRAAIHASKAGKSVLLVEQEVSVGGACVHRGTIPSKTLRETALSLTSFQQRSGHVFKVGVNEELQVSSLMTRMEQVVKAHERYMEDQIAREKVTRWHGRARFVDAITVDVSRVDRTVLRARGKHFCIATGSQPRTPSNVDVDHTNVLDSDSILSMIYLPRSLAVLGGGVIACEYASIFAALGVDVTLIDSRERPLGFLDKELVERFLLSFQKAGGKFVGGRRIKRATWDGVSQCVTTFEDGTTVSSEKLLCCLGRVANLDGLAPENAGVKVTEQGVIEVDEHLRTSAKHIYGIGDVIGPPSLASTSMEQGRRAISHAYDLPEGTKSELIPMGIYTIPEISSVGLTEDDARKQHVDCIVGRARFDQVARGQIAAITDGLLKLVCDAAGKRVLGVQIVGEGASDLVHIGQMALIGNIEVDVFIEYTFNFPTLAEAYRIAAIDVVEQRVERARAQDPSLGLAPPAGLTTSTSKNG